MHRWRGPLARRVCGGEIGSRFLSGGVTLRRIGIERYVGHPVPVAGGKPEQEKENGAAHQNWGVVPAGGVSSPGSGAALGGAFAGAGAAEGGVAGVGAGASSPGSGALLWGGAAEGCDDAGSSPGRGAALDGMVEASPAGEGTPLAAGAPPGNSVPPAPLPSSSRSAAVRS